jgi:DnaK suppressor protein
MMVRSDFVRRPFSPVAVCVAVTYNQVWSPEAQSPLNKKEVEFFRDLLNQRMQELRSEAGKTVEDMDEDENFPDPSDRASMESNRNSILRIRDRERKLIFKIQEALQRLEAGEFGICEECGEKIGIERLKARPVTTLCINCKASQEIAERKAKRLL